MNSTSLPKSTADLTDWNRVTNKVTMELEYLVKWESYGSQDNTWEPQAHLDHCPEVCNSTDTSHPNNISYSTGPHSSGVKAVRGPYRVLQTAARHPLSLPLPSRKRGHECKGTHTIVTLLLHRYYTVVTLLLHCCHTVVTLLLHSHSHYHRP
jgi:hypothetical protein